MKGKKSLTEINALSKARLKKVRKKMLEDNITYDDILCVYNDKLDIKREENVKKL